MSHNERFLTDKYYDTVEEVEEVMYQMKMKDASWDVGAPAYYYNMVNVETETKD